MSLLQAQGWPRGAERQNTVFSTAPPFLPAHPPAPGTAGSSGHCPETQLGWLARTCAHPNPEACGLPTRILPPRGWERCGHFPSRNALSPLKDCCSVFVFSICTFWTFFAVSLPAEWAQVHSGVEICKGHAF